jgi:cyclopropane fatty-acyl-phospholipid synthase-like methyltransferase
MHSFPKWAISSWNGYDLILSTSMLEYLPKEEVPSALSSLRSRLAQNGALLVVITRKNLMTKFLIEWWWHARRYSRRDLQEAFAAAGFRNAILTTSRMQLAIGSSRFLGRRGAI